MRILIVSMDFWPDSSSGSQHITDLAEALVLRGHNVNVFTSRSDYQDPSRFYAPEETYRGIHIRRLKQTTFKKSNKIGRILNVFTFNLSLLGSLLFIKSGNFDLIIGITTPPLSVFFDAVVADFKKIRFCVWAMDFQPELSIIAGYMNKLSPLVLILSALNKYALRNTDLIITLDKYMAKYLSSQKIEANKISIIPVWPVLESSYDGVHFENPFRRKYDFNDKIVIMYSGNHSVVHPLDTLLMAAKELKGDKRFLFVFVGGGVRKEEVTNFKNNHKLNNILQLPYQERSKIHISLSAADIHVVVHGNGCTGYTHPNKIYGSMLVCRPILYIGQHPSHITDVLDQCPGNLSVEHGQVERLVVLLREFETTPIKERNKIGIQNMEFVKNNFNKDNLLDKFISALESMPPR
jgi:glycosyltransferase involved in cell wall biosynthesis